MTIHRVLPVGRTAILLEVGSSDDAQALYLHLERLRATGELRGVLDLVPGARTVLVDGDPELPGLAWWDELRRTWRPPPARELATPVVEIPVWYDGPDLPEVARLTGLSIPEVIAAHTSVELRVAFCGFAPGFAYLTGLPDALRVPRRDTPRTAVPAGSVALAGGYTAVYPRRSPGGWRLIGRTAMRMWDPDREPPALLTPGTRVRFVPESTEAHPEAGTPEVNP